MSMSYCINDADIIHDVIDNDVVMINLRNGKYYTLNTTGALLWSSIMQGYSLTEVIDVIASRFAIELENVKTQVESFLALLLEERLVLQQASSSGTSSVADASLTSAMDAYVAPRVSMFFDLIGDAFAS